ncbi:GGDEF domain-containing phosphodiesterase [Treponema sp.]|uniref:putative bifunctional diguanylate cyclase/phosphodiesterase n=1 Tax=Treponema sp. TaxID=166 RepID=UPI00298DF197|nr:GGDEF domain-containing phosphodiesterase [Treponema sp.]MCQ2240714.1 GGDEF domain-containing phosphodiesterase [Treponema sp.]
MNYQHEYNKSHRDRGRSFEDLSKEEIYEMLYHDSITGYYNWTHMWHALDPQNPKDYTYGFVHFDIKDFKMINDVYGHGVANNVLRMVCHHIEKQDWVIEGCRCDNDNFAMMVTSCDNETLRKRLEKFFEEISFLSENKNYKLFYRCGVVTVEDAIKKADTVADLAKLAQAQGKKHYCTEIMFFTSEMYERIQKEQKYLTYLGEAINNDEFLVYLQPKYDIKTEKITGAEALVRWNYKHEKILSPGEFISVFESNDVIGKVDQVVLTKVCIFLDDMKKQGLPLHPISVNLSRRRMENKHLKEQILATVDFYEIPHEMIEFELTESAAYSDRDSMLQLLSELRDLGFLISMDDFGTGYSSLSLLKDMPMDTLKVDKCFVDSILTSSETSKECILLKEIIWLSKMMGFCCIAEGAETKEQVDFLRNAGCDKIQGFYYSKPIPMEDYILKIKEERK